MIESFLLDIDPIEVSDNFQEKYLIFHIEGGLGKHIAATALLKDLSIKYNERKIILVVGYPEIFLNNPYIYRVYTHGITPYFYQDYIEGKDTIIFRHEPYFESSHVYKKKHLIENWCHLLDINYNHQTPEIQVNYVQRKNTLMWGRDKPVMVIQTNGGPLSTTNSYSWTRDMPYELAVSLSEIYSKDYHIIQVCHPNSLKIPNVEVVDYVLSNFELSALIVNSSKRILIDSSLQHIAAAFNLPSIVLWIGTSPQVFGYNLHSNLLSRNPTNKPKLIDSYLFDYSFEGKQHECPYTNVEEMFHIEDIIEAINKI